MEIFSVAFTVTVVINNITIASIIVTFFFNLYIFSPFITTFCIFFNLLYNTLQYIKYQENIVALRKEIYEIMQESNRQGLVSTSDTVKANKAYVNGTSDLINYKKNKEILMHQLAVLIGESPENASSIKRNSLDKMNYQLAIPTQIPSEIITQRPDYLKSEIMLQKAGIDVKVARKEFLPTFNIGAFAMFLSNDLGSLWSTKNTLAGLGGGLGLPLFTGGRRIANLKLKKDEYERLLNNYYKTNLTAIQEVNDALVSIRLDHEKYQDVEKQAKLEREDFGYSTNKYNQGTISKLDLIQVKENVLFTDQQVVNDKINCYVNYIGLYKAVGTQL